MNATCSFGKYEISAGGEEKLESIKRLLKDDPLKDENYSLWVTVTGKFQKVDEKIETESEVSEDDEQEVEEKDTSTQYLSTQYYFTQPTNIKQKEPIEHASIRICDVVESLYEGLQRTNGMLDTVYLESLSDEELEHVANKLADKICPKGFYNLCHSILNMNVEQRIAYMNVICTQILLPKIIEVEEPSRLMCSAIKECTEKFPDDIQKFIFVPVLNVELKDVTILNIIVNACDSHRKTLLLSEFLMIVKELKQWHISVLLSLLCTETDECMNDRLIELFSEKASYYSEDKNFGKLILSFLKLNKNLTDEQADLLWEVAAINETIFKGAIENILSTMCD